MILALLASYGFYINGIAFDGATDNHLALKQLLTLTLRELFTDINKKELSMGQLSWEKRPRFDGGLSITASGAIIVRSPHLSNGPPIAEWQPSVNNPLIVGQYTPANRMSINGQHIQSAEMDVSRLQPLSIVSVNRPLSF